MSIKASLCTENFHIVENECLKHEVVLDFTS